MFELVLSGYLPSVLYSAFIGIIQSCKYSYNNIRTVTAVHCTCCTVHSRSSRDTYCVLLITS